MRELTEIERYVYNPAFAAFGLFMAWLGARIFWANMQRNDGKVYFVLNIQTFRGAGLAIAGLFLAGVAILMTILGHALLPS